MRPLSEDLRQRIIAARASGEGTGEVCQRFRVSRKSVERFWKQYQQSGHCRPKQIGGYRRSRLRPHEPTLRRWIAQQADLTLAELQQRWPRAQFQLDPKAGRYRISRIFRGANEEPGYRSPLGEAGVDARVGDYVLAIDGHELGAGDDPYVLLRDHTDPVTLTLNAKPTLEGARKVTYNPILSEASLEYLDFVLTSKERVDKLSGGKVGYVHIPDMGAPGIAEFIKWFYPQIRKEGLLIDDRANGGGNVSQMVRERLGKKLLGTRFGRVSEAPTTYPSTVFHGPMACLVSETSASDGDIFPYHFRFAGLGPLIGKRTWGGVVGISDSGPLLDGGVVFVPQSGTNAPTGEWIIEGEGVTPDIEVENEPKATLEGHDLQLERGVQEVLKAMAEHPMKLPVKPVDPVKTH